MDMSYDVATPTTSNVVATVTLGATGSLPPTPPLETAQPPNSTRATGALGSASATVLARAAAAPLPTTARSSGPKEFFTAIQGKQDLLYGAESDKKECEFRSDNAVTSVIANPRGNLWWGSTYLFDAGAAARSPLGVLADKDQRNDGVGLDAGSRFAFYVRTADNGDKLIEFKLPVRDQHGAVHDHARWQSFLFRTSRPLQITDDGFLRFSGKTWTANKLEELIECRGFQLAPSKPGDGGG
jgi:hypothetical protein